MELNKLDVYIKLDGTSKPLPITDLVYKINVIENLSKNLTGNMEIVDGVGLSDTNINIGSSIIIELTYFKTVFSHQFVVDGITDMDLTTHQHKKTYNINLGSLNDLQNSSILLSKVYSGLSSEIINNIYNGVYGNDSLTVLADSVTKGQYIAPNISPKSAVKEIMSKMYDKDITPFFIFEKFSSNSCLTSLEAMTKAEPVFTITPKIINESNISHAVNRIGIASNIIIHKEHNDVIAKLGSGVYGSNTNEVDLAFSNVAKATYGDYPNSAENITIVRDNMYDIGITSLLNKRDSQNISNIKSIYARIDTLVVSAYGVQAIPSLHVGNKLSLELTTNEAIQKYNNKYSGGYIISNIAHHIDVTTLDYTQSIDMFKG